MYNKVILVGNLTRDIELRYSQGGHAIAKTAIATSRKYTANGEKKEEVCFVDVVMFGRTGEVANQYLRKGSKILTEGRLQLEQWVDNNGQKRSKHSVVVESMQMLDSKNEGQNNAAQNQNYAAPQQQQQSYGQPTQQQNAQKKEAPRTDNIPVIDIDEDEIPPF